MTSKDILGAVAATVLSATVAMGQWTLNMADCTHDSVTSPGLPKLESCWRVFGCTSPSPSLDWSAGIVVVETKKFACPVGSTYHLAKLTGLGNGVGRGIGTIYSTNTNTFVMNLRKNFSCPQISYWDVEVPFNPGLCYVN